MAVVLKKIVIGTRYISNDISDPRVDDYFLMSSLLVPFTIGIGYLLLVNVALPKFMKDRPPYELKKVLIAFNAIQVILNAYLFGKSASVVWNYSWTCQPVDYSVNPESISILRHVYLYFLLKLSDLLDTIFFILRKKSGQVSFLHVYHHFGMITLGWVGTKYVGGGHSAYLGLGNTLVHTVMYSYYLLTIWNPELRKNIWWKKYITQLQLAQFVFFLIMYGQVLFNGCDFPKICSLFMTSQSIFMVFLFGDFYRKAYISKKRKPKIE